MKWLCTILALLVLTLSVQPVCTLFNAQDTCCRSVSAPDNCGTDNCDCDDEAPQKECRTGCNPFQVCSCCAFTVMHPSAAYFSPAISFAGIAPQWSVHYDRFYKAPEHGIWQPPRFA